MTASRTKRVVRRASGYLAPVAGVAGVQVLIQVLGFLAGIVVVRSLDKGEYASYGIAIAAVSAAAVLSDLGVNSRLLAALGVISPGSAGVRGNLAAAGAVRRRIVLVVAPALALLTGYMLVANGTGGAIALAVVTVMIATVYGELGSSLYMVVLQVHGEISRLQLILAGVNVFRIGAVILLWASGVHLAVGFLVVQALAAWLKIALLKKSAAKLAPHADSLEVPRAPYYLAARQTAVQTLLVVTGPQLMNLLLTGADNAAAIADITALGRYAVAFSILNAVAAHIAAPAIARSAASRSATSRALLVVSSAYGVAVVAYVAIAWIFSDIALGLLGPQYADLNAEFVILAASAGVTSFAVYGIGTVTHARAWTAYSWIYAPAFSLWLAAVLVFCDLGTTRGAVIAYAALCLVDLTTQIARVSAGMIRARS